MAEQMFFSVTNSGIAGSNMGAVSGSAIPELSGLTITEQANSSLQEQPVYLDSYSANGTFSQYGSAGNVETDTTSLQVDAAAASAKPALYALSGNVAQLIKFETWNQSGPYNDLCPVNPTSNPEKRERTAVGCMVTATAQVFYYWHATKAITFSAADKYEFMIKGNKKTEINIDRDASKYDFPTLATLNKTLSSIKYDFSDAEKAAVSFGLGIKLKAKYSAETAASLDAGVNAFKLASGFISAGVLSVTPATQFRDEYVGVIIDNLQKGQPVITSISNVGEDDGHAVIIDGFRESDQKFHFNMGWGGKEDDWYSLKSIPGFNQIDQYLIDVFPTGKANEIYTVTNTNDYGVGSLRRAVEMANNKNGTDTIVFDPSLKGKTITLSTGQLFIEDSLNIVGLGQKSLTISGGWTSGKSGGSSVFAVGCDGHKGINVAFSGFTLTGCNGKSGGAIYNEAKLSMKNISINNSISADYGGALCNNGVLTANALTISGNRAVYGGGIANGGTFTISNSTISGNIASSFGGGVLNSEGGIFKSYNCTIAGNRAGSQGGGIYNLASMEINNTLVSRNISRYYRDIAGAVLVSSRNNLVSDGGTSKLANNVNGNKVGTSDKQLDAGFVAPPDSVSNPEDADYRLLATSAAVNAGDDSVVSGDTDLADNARLNGTVDIGAYEFQGEDNVRPATPTGLAVTVAEQTATLDWNDATDSFGSVASYELQADRQSDFKSLEFADYFTDSGALIKDIPGGRYFWRVRTEDTAGNLSDWSKAAEFTVTPADAAGSKLQTANNIDSGVDNWIGFGDTIDIYKLTMAHNGALNLNLTGLDADVNLSLLSSTGKVIETSAGRGSLPEDIDRELAAGDYYVKVQLAPKSSESSYYTLAHEVNYFPDDTAGNTLAAARNITASGTVNEWLGFEDKSDFYKFELKTATAAKFDLTGLESNVNLYLYNGKGKLLALSAKNGIANESISKSLAAGVYYLNAAAVGSGNTGYDLNFGIDPAAFKAGGLKLFGNALPAVSGSAAALADESAKKNQGMLA